MTNSDEQPSADMPEETGQEVSETGKAAADKNKPNVQKNSDDLDPDTSSEEKTEEIGGPKGLEPTRYGDWERKGILSDF